MIDMKELVRYHSDTLRDLKINTEKLKKSRDALLKNAQEFDNLAMFAKGQANDLDTHIRESERLIKQMEKQTENYPVF